MLAAGYGSISDIEIFWTLMAAVGLIFSIINLWGVWGDWRFIKAMGIGNGRAKLAPLAVFTEIKRGYLQLMFFVIGIFSMTIPEVPQQNLEPKMFWFGIIFRWGLIFAAMLTCAATVYSFRVRRQIMSGEMEFENSDLRRPE